ncbi:NAD(P)-binding protein [Cylindrobasidium torrendii FP15055 ss-10]|uniref:NAD(P)-binding protein n=1 Tax=Cylindrobasidium torrendii FP15055 ss-10 TaxID=1314674 RepID=A0A0D7BWM7_9AGAR|nr:NAD(P)-binding protein [Cylindrobasidium torrendii FP15055 ss-10]
MTVQPLLIVAGIGNAAGTGAATARLFAKSGYAVALLSRARDGSNAKLDSLVKEIKESGGEAKAFPLQAYDTSNIVSAFKGIQATYPTDKYSLRAALWNAGDAVWKPFLEITEEELDKTFNTNTRAAFSFSRETILRFKANTDVDEQSGTNGTLIFTGATASIRGNKLTSAFSTAKSGLRALSQSLAKEFGPSGIHVGHSIIDGRILTERADGVEVGLRPESIAQSYLDLTKQHKSAWTWELDLRPAEEKW